MAQVGVKQPDAGYRQEEEQALEALLTYRKPRQKRGLRKFERILDSANTLIAERGVHNFSLYDIADHADVASGSVYHFFPNIEAVFVALVERYDREFKRIVSENVAPDQVVNWSDVLWHHIEKSRHYINSNEQVLILIIGPGQTWQTKQVDTVGDSAIARAMFRNISDYFDLPEEPDTEELLHLSIRILESIWQLSYQRHGRVTREMQLETFRAMCAYLELYWPKYLPRRNTESTS